MSGATITGSLSDALSDFSKSFPNEYVRFGGRNADWLRDEIRSETPVGEGANTTHLRDSYYIVGPRTTKRTATFRVATDVKYAPWVEWDTGIHGPRGSKYIITGKRGNLLSFYWKKKGKKVVTRYVMHPGSAGAHMFAKGADALERALPKKMNNFVVKEARRHGFRVRVA